MYKKFILSVLTIIMFSFNNSLANYEKKFYDFEIESVSGEIVKLDTFKDKIVL